MEALNGSPGFLGLQVPGKGFVGSGEVVAVSVVLVDRSPCSGNVVEGLVGFVILNHCFPRSEVVFAS